MGNRLSSVDEMRLTHAIEKAATLASVSDADRSELLAGQLKKADVDPKFAKVASAAFNKRLTVLTLEKTADEHKADSFPLADAAVVCEMMGGDAEGGMFRKSASYDPVSGVFEIAFEAFSMPVMKKVASMPRHENIESRLDYRQLQDKVEILLEKSAAAYQELDYKRNAVDSMLNKKAAELSSMLCSATGSDFILDRLNAIHGPEFSAELMSRMPAEMPKRAHAADPMDIYKAATEFSDLNDIHNEYVEFLGNYNDGLMQLSKAAAVFGNQCAKAEMYGLTKEAVAPGVVTSLEAAKMLAGAGADAFKGAANAAGNIYNTTRETVGGALLAYDSLRKADKSPSDFMDAEFIARDRQRDRLMAFTDMASDPAFAMYPAEQVFSAANTIMDTDKDLESPARREFLRSQMGQLLAQNGRQSTADIAATATTLKAFNDAAFKGRAVSAFQAVKDLNDVTGTDKGLPVSLLGPPALNFNMLSMESTRKGINEAIDTIEKGIERSDAAKSKAAEAKRQALKDKLQAERQAKADAKEKDLAQYKDEVLNRVNTRATDYIGVYNKAVDNSFNYIGDRITTARQNAAARGADGDSAASRIVETVRGNISYALAQHRGDWYGWLSSVDGMATLGALKAISDSSSGDRAGSAAVLTVRVPVGKGKMQTVSIDRLIQGAQRVADLKGKTFPTFESLNAAAIDAGKYGTYNPMSGVDLIGGGKGKHK